MQKLSTDDYNGSKIITILIYLLGWFLVVIAITILSSVAIMMHNDPTLTLTISKQLHYTILSVLITSGVGLMAVGNLITAVTETALNTRIIARKMLDSK